MSDSVDTLSAELFVVRQRLAEAHMSLVEADEQKEQLRDAAAATLAELRTARDRIAVLEAELRRAERERELAALRAERETAEAETVRGILVRAQGDLVAAHDAANESEALVDQLQLQVFDLRRELSRARGFVVRER